MKQQIKVIIFALRRIFYRFGYSTSTTLEYIIHKLKRGNFETRLRKGISLEILENAISNNKKKRLALYVAYHNPDIIPESNLEYVKGLINCFFDVLYIHNGNLSQHAIEKLRQVGCIVICRENIGQDFGAWKDLILYLKKYHLLYELNWLLICNDSNFYIGGENGASFEKRFNED